MDQLVQDAVRLTVEFLQSDAGANCCLPTVNSQWRLVLPPVALWVRGAGPALMRLSCALSRHVSLPQGHAPCTTCADHLNECLQSAADVEACMVDMVLKRLELHEHVRGQRPALPVAPDLDAVAAEVVRVLNSDHKPLLRRWLPQPQAYMSVPAQCDLATKNFRQDSPPSRCCASCLQVRCSPPIQQSHACVKVAPM